MKTIYKESNPLNTLASLPLLILFSSEYHVWNLWLLQLSQAKSTSLLFNLLWSIVRPGSAQLVVKLSTSRTTIIARLTPPRHEFDWLSLYRIARKSATFFATVSPAKSTVVTTRLASVSMAIPPARCYTSRKLARSQAFGSGSPPRKWTLRKCSTRKSPSHTRAGPPTALPRS